MNIKNRLEQLGIGQTITINGTCVRKIDWTTYQIIGRPNYWDIETAIDALEG